MRVIKDIGRMQHIASGLKKKNQSIGFVATMGALHEGHLSLIRQSRRENKLTVVSIFVNPAQFGAQEDFKRYPRPLAKDIASCRQAGVDFVFCPNCEDMYPDDYKTFVTVEELSTFLCGATRPGHFRGVTTVVSKLFNIVQPDSAYFGQKDAQQAIIISRMAKDLNFPVKIKTMPIVRGKDGLALSSRNVYLNEQEREEALVLSESLKVTYDLIKAGVSDAQRIMHEIKSLIQSKKNIKIEYVALVDLHSLKPITTVKDGCLIALAVRIGKTRLIDNLLIKKGRLH